MQAIRIAFKATTETLSARWTASAEAGKVGTPQHSFFDKSIQAVKAAKSDGVVRPKGYALWTLLTFKGWKGLWIIGKLPDGSYAAVCADPQAPLSIRLS